MNVQKISIITLITLIIITAATALIINIRPQMHKSFMLENIIFVRSK